MAGSHAIGAARVADRPVNLTRGTLEADAQSYLAQVKHLASNKSRVCEVDAWTAEHGRRRRSQITAEHVRKVRAAWLADGYSPKTINNRVQTLQHLYRTLDGSRAVTPADDVKPLPVPPSQKVLVPAKVFRTVVANLTDPKTKARFVVIASTGVRPAEVKRTEPGDVDMERRAWIVRTAKGGEPRALWLNDDMKAAWEAFIAADAWGAFDASDQRQGALCRRLAEGRQAIPGAPQHGPGARGARRGHRGHPGRARTSPGRDDTQARRARPRVPAEAGESDDGGAIRRLATAGARRGGRDGRPAVKRAIKQPNAPLMA